MVTIQLRVTLHVVVGCRLFQIPTCRLALVVNGILIVGLFRLQDQKLRVQVLSNSLLSVLLNIVRWVLVWILLDGLHERYNELHRFLLEFARKEKPDKEEDEKYFTTTPKVFVALRKEEWRFNPRLGYEELKEF